MPESQHDEIVKKFTDKDEAKLELITAWLASHPCPTWEQVVNLIMWYRGMGGEKEIRELEEKNVKSESEIKLREDGSSGVQ